MGVWITEDLLRRRSEHNEGVISTMEEITLHQQKIDRITLLNSACRKLKIIYLQNNNIRKIENINRLKDLDYLNLAINKIEQVEGLSRCESLQKLDFTVNRIGARGLLTVERLAANERMNELYLTGNPCTLIAEYRAFVVAVIPQLTKLDGVDILPSERIAALQDLAENRAAIERECLKEDVLPEVESDSDSDDEEKPEPEPSKFAPAPKVKQKTPSAIPDESGHVRQCNEGKWKFSIEERDADVLVEVMFSKYLDTSLIDADVQPTHIRVTSKGKTLQLNLPADVRTDTSTAQRNKTSGSLVLACKKCNPTMRRQELVGVAPVSALIGAGPAGPDRGGTTSQSAAPADEDDDYDDDDDDAPPF